MAAILFFLLSSSFKAVHKLLFLRVHVCVCVYVCVKSFISHQPRRIPLLPPLSEQCCNAVSLQGKNATNRVELREKNHCICDREECGGAGLKADHLFAAVRDDRRVGGPSLLAAGLVTLAAYFKRMHFCNLMHSAKKKNKQDIK